jgi:hypothetical protein
MMKSIVSIQDSQHHLNNQIRLAKSARKIEAILRRLHSQRYNPILRQLSLPCGVVGRLIADHRLGCSFTSSLRAM